MVCEIHEHNKSLVCGEMLCAKCFEETMERENLKSPKRFPVEMIFVHKRAQRKKD